MHRLVLKPKLAKHFSSKLKLFMANPDHVLLRRHPLRGKYGGCYSINISGDLRAIFRYQSQTSVVFCLIGTHPQLY